MPDTAEPMDVSAPEPAPETDKPASNETATPSAADLETKSEAPDKDTSATAEPEGDAVPASKKRIATEAAGTKVYVVRNPLCSVATCKSLQQWESLTRFGTVRTSVLNV